MEILNKFAKLMDDGSRLRAGQGARSCSGLLRWTATAAAAAAAVTAALGSAASGGARMKCSAQD